MFLYFHQSVEELAQQPCQHKVDDGNDNQREEGIKGAASHKVGGLREVDDSDITHNRGTL